MFRTLLAYLKEHPEFFRKILMIAGPRQVGKTTLLQQFPFILQTTNSRYLNWDNDDDRELILKKKTSRFLGEMLTKSNPLLLLDEIHKYPRWKNYLKGIYDTHKNSLTMAVSGSSKLDTYRKGGESLLGRYWLFRLNPLTLAEILQEENFGVPKAFSITSSSQAEKTLEALLTKGGFPEPYYTLTPEQVVRWRSLRKEVLVKGDLRDLSRIQELTGLRTLMDMLPSRVGSVLSLNSLREDLEINHATITNWLKWISTIYYCFTIAPYARSFPRALKKGPKLYLYDWSEIGDEGARFENFTACHLKKACDFYTDTGKGNFDICYLRDKEGHEVDFLILRENKPWMLVETKLSDDQPGKGLIYFANRISHEHCVLLVQKECKPRRQKVGDLNVWVTGAAPFFKGWI